MSNKGGPVDLYDLLDLLEEGGDSFGWIISHGDQAIIDDVWARTSNAGTLAEVYDMIYPEDLAWRTRLARAYVSILRTIVTTPYAELDDIEAALSIRAAGQRHTRLSEIAARYDKPGSMGTVALAVSRIGWLASQTNGTEWGTSIADLATSAVSAVAKLYLNQQWNYDKGFADYVRSVTPPPRLEDVVARLERRTRQNPAPPGSVMATYERCVREVQKKSRGVNAYAVCTSSLRKTHPSFRKPAGSRARKPTRKPKRRSRS